MSEGLRLYTYWRSSAAWRVRIGLELKGLACEQRPVHLLRDGGGQHAPHYARLNPQQLVPTLLHGGRVLRQSLAILEYLDECWPEPPLLPASAHERARVRALAQLVACDIHPLANLRVRQYLRGELQVDAVACERWSAHWVGDGLAALEALLAEDPATGRFCHGDRPGLADCCLVPQLYNARRLGLEPAQWPTLARIEQACLALPAFETTRPERQADAE
ncbi:MAG: maleylacetoacetate isomerase [Pseudoxanthomonas sp.]